MTEIAAVISFCSYDLRFLDKCIQSVKPFSKQILIPICDHFYDGKKEDYGLLQKIYQKYPEVDFVEFAYSEVEVYGTPSKLVSGSPGWSQHWHNSARLVGSYFLKKEIDRVLFLDVDEIFSGNLLNLPIAHYDALRFATYWYFKSAAQCATVYPDGPLLIKRDLLTTELLIDPDERMGMFCEIKGVKEREFLVSGKPIVHHYSWVRTPEEMLQKVGCWGHHWERDWKKLLKQEGDFARGYTYQTVHPFWDPLQEDLSFPEKDKEKRVVPRVTTKDIFRMEIAAEIGIFRE